MKGFFDRLTLLWLKIIRKSIKKNDCIAVFVPEDVYKFLIPLNKEEYKKHVLDRIGKRMSIEEKLERHDLCYKKLGEKKWNLKNL